MVLCHGERADQLDGVDIGLSGGANTMCERHWGEGTDVVWEDEIAVVVERSSFDGLQEIDHGARRGALNDVRIFACGVHDFEDQTIDFV